MVDFMLNDVMVELENSRVNVRTKAVVNFNTKFKLEKLN